MKDMRIHEVTKPKEYHGARGWTYETEHREVEVLAISGRYAMVRRKGAVPYVCFVKELSKC